MAAAASAAAASAPGLMMFLKPESAALSEEILRRTDSERRAKTTLPTELRITDLDDTHYRVEVPEDNVDIMRVSMFMPFFKELEAVGVQEHLRTIYGAALVAPREGAHVTLEFPIAAGKEPSKDFVKAVANMRRHAVACAFTSAMATVAGGKAATTTPPIVIRLRQYEPISIFPRPDRVSVVYALEFADPTDRAVARIIAQEFVEAQRHVSNAPPVNFSDKEPPMELRGRAAKQTENFVGYLTFAVFPKHYDNETKKAAVINQLVMFRNYLDYHIKAAKSYLHMRMRARVDSWMQVLNRAHPEDPFAAKEAKTITGRTFTRKV